MKVLEFIVSRYTYYLSIILCVLLEASANTNIILIVTDDQRWDATGFMQERMSSLGRTARFPWMENNTPNLDRLSEEGVHFDNGYGVYSLCSPARATMLTGQYPHKHGITNNQTDFPSDVVTYANLLQAAGYTTGYFGKWHMGTQDERPGFDYVRTFYGQGKYFGTEFNDENGNPVNSSTSTYNPQSQQSIVINVTDLPSGGATQSVYKTLLNGNNFYQTNFDTLSLGSNTFTINAVDFDRSAFFRFSSGEIQFNSLVYNGEQLLSNPGVPTTIQASGLFEPRSQVAWPYRIGITAAGVSTWSSSISANEWIDDTSTNYAIEFIEDQASSENPFMLFLGFKTPHEGSQNTVSNWYPPARTDGIFSGKPSANVPNLDVSPPFAPDANPFNSNDAYNQNYCETIAGIDGCVGNILAAVQAAGIDDETAIIFISDNGFFRGEHDLSDKRAAYEESVRLPFMIRHPSAHTTSGQIVNEIVSNLDIAPTILDLAGIEVPSSMQGASLVPFIRGEVPNNWRDKLFIEYNHDAEFPTANVRPYISLVHENGLKIVRYQENASWNELFDTRTSVDPYEINNLISSGALVDQQNRATMEDLLSEEMYNTDFLKILKNSITNSCGSLTLAAGEGSPFKLESSADLESWQEEGSFEGDNEAVTISALNSMGFSGPTMSYTSTLNGKSLEPFTVIFDAINFWDYTLASSTAGAYWAFQTEPDAGSNYSSFGNFSEAVNVTNWPNGTPSFSYSGSKKTNFNNYGLDYTAYDGSIWGQGKALGFGAQVTASTGNSFQVTLDSTGVEDISARFNYRLNGVRSSSGLVTALSAFEYSLDDGDFISVPGASLALNNDSVYSDEWSADLNAVTAIEDAGFITLRWTFPDLIQTSGAQIRVDNLEIVGELIDFDTTVGSSATYRDLLYDNTESPTSWSIHMGALSSPATVTVEFLPTPSSYSSGTFSVYDSIQTDIWDASVDVLGSTATFKQVAQVSGVTSDATISGGIGTTHDGGYIELAAMRVTIDYNPGQLRYNIDFGPFVFDADDNDAVSGFGTNYTSWNAATGNSVSLNPFSAADPAFGDYASISTVETIDEDGSEAAVSLNSVIVIGDDGDHVLRSGTPPDAAIDAYEYSTLAVGSTSSDPSGGRNAVLIFELPSIESDQQIHSATVAVTVQRLNDKTDFDADLWSLGIYDANSTDPDGDGLVEYHENATSNTNLVKLQDAFLNDLIAGTDSETDSVQVTSSLVSRLSDYLWQFYNSNPTYSGGKYLHLRVSPEIGSINDIGGENVQYTIKAAHSANDDSEKPVLTINLKDQSDVAKKRFYRIRYGED